MLLLERYIIKEHIGPFFFSLAVIMFVFITKFIAQYIGRIFGKGLPLLTIVEFIYLNLAWMLALAVPMAVLVASLMAFGRLSADNEITILKTSGISLYKIIRPVLVMAIIITLVMFWFNDKVLPEYNHRARLLFQSISRKKPSLQLEEGLYITIGNFNILVEEIEKTFSEQMIEKTDITGVDFLENKSDRLKNITIFDRSKKDLQRTVIAKRGHLFFDEKTERLIFSLFDGEIHEIDITDYSQYRRLKFPRYKVYIPAPDLVFKKTQDEWRSDREMSISMMRNEIKRYHNSIQKEYQKIQNVLKEYFLNPDTLQKKFTTFINTEEIDTVNFSIMQMARSKALRKTQAIIQKLKNSKQNIKNFENQIYKFEVEIHKKFSIPFASIVFVLIGAPLGIKARKGSLGIGFTFSIGFFLLYWVFLIGGEELADRQIVSPFIAMWLANLIVGFFGVYLTYRTVKETTFIRWEKLPKFLQLFFKGEENNQ